MNRRHLIIINLIFVAFITFSAGVVYQFMTGKRPLEVIGKILHRDNQTPTVATDRCNKRDTIGGLQDSRDPQLKTLYQYQLACHSFVTDTVMLFTDMPVSDPSAKLLAGKIAPTLKEFAKYKIRPLVIAEPNGEWGNLDFGEFAKGFYDPWIDTYFKELKAAGISDEQMGIWSPFPEANLPYWNNNLPEYFAPAVNNYFAKLKKYFPKAKTSILLNSATYEVDDFDWLSGEYISLLQYVKGIKPGSVDYAGLQGFPWLPAAGREGGILNGAEFVNSNLLSEMADNLKTKNVWFNTGTFASKYTLDPARRVEVTPERRKDVLTTINQEALGLKQKGYNVAINIFAEDKSQQAEATNWAYWDKDKPFESLATPVITDFITQVQQQGMAFWLFDRKL